MEKRLVDRLPVVVFEYTFFPDGARDFTYISPRCAELLKIQPDEILQGHLSMKDYIHPDDWILFMESVEFSKANLKEMYWQGRYTIHGEAFWLETKGSPEKKEDGRIVYYGIISDITLQKRLEKERSEVEKRYRDLVENLSIGIAIHTGGTLRYVNAAAARMMGATSPEDLIGKNAFQFVHPDSEEVIRKRMSLIHQGISVPPIHEKYVRLDGTVLEVETSAQPFVFEGEQAVQAIFSDITAWKRAEAGFRKSETLFYQLFENTPVAIVLLEHDGKVLQVNRGFEEMFGYNSSELKGGVLNDFIIPDGLELEGNQINALISENQAVHVETQRKGKDQKLLSVIIYGVPVLQENQKIGIFGMYVDITQRKKVEEELKIRNAELDNFVYKVSHDLRAPLSSVLGLAHLATLPGNTDNLGDYVKLMGKKASQLDHFISDVLSHSKNLKMDLKVEAVDFNRIVEQAFSDLSYLEGYNQVERTVTFPDLPFYSDPWRVGEIFRNLVSNAIKYRKMSGEVTKVDVTIEVTEVECVIKIKDNGIGIDAESLSRIFEMFYRASGQSEGSGLGLYIVKNAVEKLGGQVTVESGMGDGTSFKIVLPQHRHSK